MASNSLATRRHRRRHLAQPRDSSSSEEIETIDLNVTPSTANSHNPTTIHILTPEQV